MTLELACVSVVHQPGRPDEVRALTGVSMVIPAGELVAVVGANGAGKSSLVDVVAGALRPTSGRVVLDGRDVTRMPDHRRAGSVARVFDDPRIGTAPGLSVEDNLALAAGRGARRGLRLALSSSRRAMLRERLAGVGLGLEDRFHDQVGLLSAGQRQSLTMVMAGLARPEVLLLDEHLSALDPATAARVLRLTADLVAELRCTTLMVTHSVDHALVLGERLLVMGRGTVVHDIRGTDKRSLTAEAVVELIARSAEGVGGSASLPECGVDRTQREWTDPVDNRPVETR